jgi:hypothetical protein
MRIGQDMSLIGCVSDDREPVSGNPSWKGCLKYFVLLLSFTLLFILALIPVAAPSAVAVGKDTVAGTEERDAFVTTEVDRNSPYVGEQLIFRLKFFYRVGVTSASLEDLSCRGVQARDIKKIYYNTVVDGVRYEVTEVSKLLIPSESGDITIPGASLRCEAPAGRRQQNGDSFFGADFFNLGFQRTEPRIIRSRPITLHVRALPPKGKPSPFSGLVGSFALTAELDKKEIKEGESVTLVMTVSGKGDLSFAPRPAIQGIERFKAYDDHPVASEKIQDDQLVSVKVFKTALVPLNTGDLTIPEVSIGFFDPETGTYRNASTAPHGLELRILPGRAQDMPPVAAGEASSVIKRPAQVASRDILPIETEIDPLKDETFHLLTLPIFTAIVIPPLFYLGILTFKRKRAKFSAGLGLAKSTSALKQARKGMKDAEILATRKDPQECYAHLSKTLKTYVGNKLHLACETKTSDELKEAIRKRINEGSLVGQTAALLQELERRRFTPRISGSEAPRNLVQETQRLIEQLEKAL